MITSPALRPASPRLRRPVSRIRYEIQRSHLIDDQWNLYGVASGGCSWYVCGIDALNIWEAELIAGDIVGEPLTWTREEGDRTTSNEITEGGA